MATKLSSGGTESKALRHHQKLVSDEEMSRAKNLEILIEAVSVGFWKPKEENEFFLDDIYQGLLERGFSISRSFLSKKLSSLVKQGRVSKRAYPPKKNSVLYKLSASVLQEISKNAGSK